LNKERFAMSRITLTWAQKVKLAAALMLVGHAIAGYYAFVLTKLVLWEAPSATVDGGDDGDVCGG
jgi:predicted membrane-bound mannosyltransferase